MPKAETGVVKKKSKAAKTRSVKTAAKPRSAKAATKPRTGEASAASGDLKPRRDKAAPRSAESTRRATKAAPIAVQVEPISWKNGRLRLLDQRKLPHIETWIELRGAADTARAIRDMVVRGAPAIGVTAAFGLALEAKRFREGRIAGDFEKEAAVLHAARPTAVNLAWAIDRQRRALAVAGSAPTRAEAERLLRETAENLYREDVDANRAMGAAGAKLLRGDVLTHCNAGALATAGYGTALGVIRAAWEQGKRFRVYATETRPFLQGARLTSWELVKLGIPVTLVTDGMVGALMMSGKVGSVVVGTDRTAANGDVANKIGTYQIAVLAKRHGVPFYVAAPTSSIDLDCKSGAAIPIEERAEREVTHIGGKRIAAAGVSVFHPAFDVTPAELVTAIFTEAGVVRGNYGSGLGKAVRAAKQRLAKASTSKPSAAPAAKGSPARTATEEPRFASAAASRRAKPATKKPASASVAKSTRAKPATKEPASAANSATTKPTTKKRGGSR